MPKFAVNLSKMFTEVEFLDRFAAAAGAGFKAVEYDIRYDDPDTFDKERLAELLDQHRLIQVLHNLPPGDTNRGDRGITCLPDRVDEFQQSVETAIEYARALGCKRLECMSGVAPEGTDPETLWATLADNLRFAANKLAEVGVRLLIEPVNTRDVPGFYLCHMAQARSLVTEVGSANLGVEYDVYHMQVMEGNISRTLENNLDIIGHIQIADNPGRNEPGTGELNYPFLFDLLDSLGYDGWIGCEYEPLTTTEEGLVWAAAYLDQGAEGPAS